MGSVKDSASSCHRVDVIANRGCSRLFSGRSFSLPQSMRILQTSEPVSPASSSVSSVQLSPLDGPFSGLVICVTGLSKEARKQVMEATTRLGGQYSPDLHNRCTHLVAQSSSGRKFEHAMKHGAENGLFIVTLGWFVDSVKRNVRLSESLYNVKDIKGNGEKLDDYNRIVVSYNSEKSCIPETRNDPKPFGSDLSFSGIIMYIDEDISEGIKKKINEAAGEEGATFTNQWFSGCKVSHVICESASVSKYIGHCSNLVSPAWVIKSVKEKQIQRLVHISVDLGRQAGNLIENYHPSNSITKDSNKSCGEIIREGENCASWEERKNIVERAKRGVRNRRARGIQGFQNPIRPLTPKNLLDSISWSVSDPPSTASLYIDSIHGDDLRDYHSPIQSSFSNLTRPLSDSEKSEIIFRSHFLTILFPLDRFSEMGPSSRTFFSENGFTSIQLLDHIYKFYQENMTSLEVELAIQTDSRHSDRLRSVYASQETQQLGDVMFKRIEFLGSRRSFEMLKRVTWDNSSNVYELLIRS